jgi:chondroitin 4-sulfotransferase 11
MGCAKHISPPSRRFFNPASSTTFGYISLSTRSDLFRFTVVRNPWDRLVSCYYNKVVQVREERHPWILGRFGDAFHPDMNFAAFAMAVMKIPDDASDEHFASQWHLLNYRGKPPLDFIGRFENLSSDWERLQVKTGAGLLGHANRTRHPSYRTLYKPEMAVDIGQRYCEDVRHFGYVF